MPRMLLATISFVFALTMNLVVPVAAAEEVTAPDWTLESADGETIRLSDEVREQPVILFFWASWCPYCKALMPHLQSIRLEFGDDVEILALNFRDDGEPVEFIRNAGYDFTVLPNADEIAAEYGIFGTPGVLIVDREQVVRFDLRGLAKPEIPEDKAGHSARAAYVAPYWAAEIRRYLDSAL